MDIANGTCVSFCSQPKAHFGLPGYAPGTIAVNVTWMEKGFNAVGVFPLEFREKFGSQKTRIMGLPGSEDSLTIG